MSHSLVRILVHCIFRTKFGLTLIEEKAEKEIHDMIKKQFEAMDCEVIIVNGTANHVHRLFLLNCEKSIADVVHQVKGGTSYSINKQKLITYKFSWQVGYTAFSVSHTAKGFVKMYIANQKEHHKKRVFSKEHIEYIRMVEEK